MRYARHPDVVLRREHFGGLAFHQRSGKLIELDREACLLLEMADGSTSLRTLAQRIGRELNIVISIQEIHTVADTLRRHGFLSNARSFPIIAASWPEKTYCLSAPESVHLALTHRCNYHCRSCYVDNASDKAEMTTAEVKSLIDEMASMKVFQLAIGGGEPFLRDDLVEIAVYARLHGIVPNITTNGSLVTHEIASELSEHIGQIQLSVNGHNRRLHETSREDGSFDAALRAMQILRKHSIRFGMNVLLCKENLNSIKHIVEFAANHDATTVNFIRPKPSKHDERWYAKSALSRNEYKTAKEAIKEAQSKYPVKITVDCALTFMMNKEEPEDLQKHGIYGCAGAMRFISIYPDGSAYPCSFLDKPEYCAGNVKGGLKNVWDAFQEFRQITRHLTDKCSTCKIRDFCRGCRAIALHETGNILSGEPGCQLPPPKGESLYLSSTAIHQEVLWLQRLTHTATPNSRLSGEPSQARRLID